MLSKPDLLAAIETATDVTELSVLNAKLRVVNEIIESNLRTIETASRIMNHVNVDDALRTFLDEKITAAKTELEALTSTSQS